MSELFTGETARTRFLTTGEQIDSTITILFTETNIFFVNGLLEKPR